MKQQKPAPKSGFHGWRLHVMIASFPVLGWFAYSIYWLSSDLEWFKPALWMAFNGTIVAVWAIVRTREWKLLISLFAIGGLLLLTMPVFIDSITNPWFGAK